LRDVSFEPGSSATAKCPLAGNSLAESANSPDVLRPGTSLASVEKRLLELTLDSTSGNRSRTAEILGVSLRTVRNKIREYNLPPRSMYAHD
jgi:DNA-binding NtrC family response regulator